MKLPDHLKKKRDELRPSDLHFRKECGDYTCGAHKSWNEGFNTACAELLPIIENLLKYCEPHTDKMWAASLVAEILKCDFRDAATELKKWRES